ncbi:MAG: FISUMP domain-containing protein [Bacteroidales bacterium]
MKPKILLSVLMIAMITGAMAQKPTMTLTFTADSNAQHVPLNSILIENLTQGGDTTLYAPDTVLVLDYITGMEEISTFSGKGFSLSQNFPNPMKDKTTVSLYLPEKENILIIVSDVIGREMVNKKFHLEQGNHSFNFYPGRESLYFLTARADNQTRTIKMFNSPSDVNASGYCKLGYNGQQKTGTGDYKSGNALNNFVFDLGDMLKFTSFTDQGERVITSSPTGDQIYYFHYTGDPCPGAPTVTDIDGNVYNTVQIGNQCWMKENLKTTTYRNGTAIPNVTDANAWSNLTTGAYVWYDNDISCKDKYGALYNWFTTVDSNGLCPTGWHVPTHDEWTALTDYIGGTSSPHGNELKSCRQVNSPLGGGCNTSEHPRWNENNYDWGTDDYGFSGLPGGTRSHLGAFNFVGGTGYWWSSTVTSSNYAWNRFLYYGNGLVLVGSFSKRHGFSVRCLRD